MAPIQPCTGMPGTEGRRHGGMRAGTRQTRHNTQGAAEYTENHQEIQTLLELK